MVADPVYPLAMKVTFQYYSREARPQAPHIPVSFDREVATLPRVGDHIVRHQDGHRGPSTIYEVVEILHTFEDRADYQGKDYGGDRIFVTIRAMPREEALVTYHALVAEQTT